MSGGRQTKTRRTTTNVPAVRILPMSSAVRGFAERSIEAVQEFWFLNRLPRGGGKYRYRSTGLLTPPRTVVLFQFRGKIIASAVFYRDQKFDQPKDESAGVLHFEADTFEVFDPIDLPTLRRAWPGAGKLGHVKQRLNPGGYARFRKLCRNRRVAELPAKPPEKAADVSNR